MVNENERVLNAKGHQYVCMVHEKVYAYPARVHPFVCMIKLRMIALFVLQIMDASIVAMYLLNTPVGNPTASVVTAYCIQM